MYPLIFNKLSINVKNNKNNLHHNVIAIIAKIFYVSKIFHDDGMSIFEVTG